MAISCSQPVFYRPRVKICGITRVEDALHAAQLGVDAIGLVFYPKSPRAISLQQAQAILQALPPFVSVVGLFVDAEPTQIYETIKMLPLDVLQFHGDETPAYCEQFRKPYIKAVRMREGVDLLEIAQCYTSAQALLLDTYVTGLKGGTGQVFNWREVPEQVNKAIILAGGLTPANISQALKTKKWPLLAQPIKGHSNAGRQRKGCCCSHE